MDSSKKGLAAALCLAGTALAAPAFADSTLTIATVNNVQMIEMQKLAPVFEKQHPDIHLKWVVLEENVLRQRVTTDIATHGGQFDILKPVRQGISYKDKLYARPFYAESVMTLYRTDLFKKAGITMPDKPTYEQIRQFADKITDKPNGIYGICLRGKPGWGENMAYVSTLVTAMGGQWFNESWTPTIDTPAWKRAISQLGRVQREPDAVHRRALRHVDRRHQRRRHRL